MIQPITYAFSISITAAVRIDGVGGVSVAPIRCLLT